MFTSRLFWNVFGLYAALTIGTAAAFMGIFEISLKDPSTIRPRLWSAAMGISVFGMGLTSLVIGRIIRPLQVLTDAAHQLTEGKLPAEVTIHGKNEIGTLTGAFNTMSRELAARIQDLQEQRKSSETNHQQLETILSAMTEGVIAVDREERILFANLAAMRLMDLKADSMLGRPIWEVIRHEAIHDLIANTMQKGGIQQAEHEIPRTQSIVAMTASRFPGKPTPGLVIVIHDVTDLRRLERLRRDFVQNVSHELKTPLSSIAAYADTLLEGALDDPAMNRPFVQRIAEQADRLHRLILDLLALARLESAEGAFEVEPIDVSRVIRASVDAHAGVAQAKQIKLLTEGPAEAVWGKADDDGLRTILDNLLDNAVNYTPNGGRITVRWSQRANKVMLQVQDTGAGIGHEHQQRIFQRFYRIDKARSRELGGTGLGLSIVKHLCQAFGGTVSVQSQLGQGSTFTVELPATSPTVTV